jgi:hypothetical protein
VLAPNGGGLAFPDGTTQITAFTGTAATAWGTISGSLSSQTDLVNALALKSNLAGATFTGKVNFTSVSGAAGLNVGIGGTSASATDNGDIWIPTAGTNLNFRDGNGIVRVCASTTSGNNFNQPQNIDTSNINPALRVTQRGSGAVLLVEDSTTPDTSALVVDVSGNVGIGVAVGFVTSKKLSVYGDSIFYGDILCNNLTAGVGATLGAVTLSSLTFSSNSITLSSIASQVNPTTSGNINYSDYPREIIITLNSVSYAVPARII